MIENAYPILTMKILKDEFNADDSATRNALTILKLLGRGEIYFASSAVVHGMMVDGMGVFGSKVGYPGKLMRMIDEPGLMMKLGGGSLTGFQYNSEEENNVAQQLNVMLNELGWVNVFVR